MLYLTAQGRGKMLNTRMRVLPPAEVILWDRIKDRQVDGLMFNRQRVLGEYVVDFYCSAGKLVIEVDAAEEESESDKHRREEFERRGMQVARFSASQIYSDLDATINQIRRLCLGS